MTDEPPAIVLPLLAEEASVSKRRVVRRRLRVRTVTRERPQELHETLVREGVTVERVPVGREIDAVPAVRTEGDVTILPVVEERLVLVRRLFLVEEVRVHTSRTMHEWNDTVMVRYQDVVVDDANVDEPAGQAGVVRAPQP